MNNRTEQIFSGSVVALVGAVAGAIATAIVNLILNGKININSWWGWGIGGLFGLLVVVLIFIINRRKKLVYGCKVSIRAFDKNYVTADLNRDRQLFGRAENINGGGIFEIVDAAMPFSQEPNRPVCYGHHVAFKALHNNRFVGADLRHDKQLTAWGTRVRSWETFTLCPTPNDRLVLGNAVRYGNFFALKAQNEMYVKCILTEDGRLLAAAPHIDKSETFVFINPTLF